MDAEAFRTSLTESGSVAVILELFDAGRKMSLSDLGGQVANYQSLRRRLALFEEDGLVDISLEMKPRKVVYVSLTPKGRKVGDRLDRVRKALPPGDISNKSVCLKYAVPVIAMLYRYGPLKHNDFLQIYKSYIPLVKKLFPALEEEGIVKQWSKENGYHSHMLDLTDDGKVIGELMNETVNIIRKM